MDIFSNSSDKILLVVDILLLFYMAGLNIFGWKIFTHFRFLKEEIESLSVHKLKIPQGFQVQQIKHHHNDRRAIILYWYMFDAIGEALSDSSSEAINTFIILACAIALGYVVLNLSGTTTEMPMITLVLTAIGGSEIIALAKVQVRLNLLHSNLRKTLDETR